MRHHLAILYRPLLKAIIEGQKKIECRLGKMGHPPHEVLSAGDLIWLKEAGGPIRAVATARSVRSFPHLTRHKLDLIRRRWSSEICAPESFWRSGRDATAATLIWLGEVCPLEPFRIVKRDLRAWVVLAGPPVPGQAIQAARLAAGR